MRRARPDPGPRVQVSESVRIQYGGSVNDKNAAELGPSATAQPPPGDRQNPHPAGRRDPAGHWGTGRTGDGGGVPNFGEGERWSSVEHRGEGWSVVALTGQAFEPCVGNGYLGTNGTSKDIGRPLDLLAHRSWCPFSSSPEVVWGLRMIFDAFIEEVPVNVGGSMVDLKREDKFKGPMAWKTSEICSEMLRC